MVAKKLDIFDLMRRADAGDYGYYASLPPDERKEVAQFIGYPMLRWMSIAQDQRYQRMALLLVDEVANPNYFKLREFPELQWKLLCAAGTRGRVRRAWIKKPKPGRPPKVLDDLLAKLQPNYEMEDVAFILDRISRADMKKLAQELGLQKDDVKDVTKAHDDWRKKRGVGD